MLQGILRVLGEISSETAVIFPIHPRTRQRIAQLGFQPGGNFHFWEPQSYLQFLALQQHATVVITDSGGIQEETTFLACLASPCGRAPNARLQSRLELTCWWGTICSACRRRSAASCAAKGSR